MRRYFSLLVLSLTLLPGVAAAREVKARKPGLKVLGAMPKLAAGPAGRLGGEGWQQGWIEAGGALTLEQRFLAGQPAAVTIVTDPPAPFAMTVAEAGEVPVCSGRQHACRWQPVFTGRYAITLRNGGGARVRYLLVVR